MKVKYLVIRSALRFIAFFISLFGKKIDEIDYYSKITYHLNMNDFIKIPIIEINDFNPKAEIVSGMI